MNSYLFDIGEQRRAGAEFISDVRDEVQRAFLDEKKARKLSQQDIAAKLGVHRVVSRQLSGLDNMTLRSVAELLWAMGWKPQFNAVKEAPPSGTNEDWVQGGPKKTIYPPRPSDGEVSLGMPSEDN